MNCAARNAASARVLNTFFRPRRLRNQPQAQPKLIHPHARYASTSPPNPDEPIVLEKPDKFRPPSHASRRNARSTTGSHSHGAAYNQGMTAREKQASQQRSYPRMFPNPGTRMHWFLTTRWVHILITFAVLAALGLASAVQTWAHTSPFAHLLPPLSMLAGAPVTYISELLAVWRLHIEYTTQRTAEHRAQNILDAQKRRLYRRAHGMEDLSAQEVSGPDVRGLVDWDDGLTEPQRQRGGVYTGSMIGTQMQEMGVLPGEGFSEMMERKRREEQGAAQRREDERNRKAEQEAKEEEERLVRIGAKRPAEQEKRKRGGLYFGIWG